MRKALYYIFTGAGIVWFLMLSFIVKGDGSETYDLFNFIIPHPPEWIAMLPWIGGFASFIAEYFSLHGIVTLLGAFIFLMLASFINEKGGDHIVQKTQ